MGNSMPYYEKVLGLYHNNQWIGEIRLSYKRTGDDYKFTEGRIWIYPPNKESWPGKKDFYSFYVSTCAGFTDFAALEKMGTRLPFIEIHNKLNGFFMFDDNTTGRYELKALNSGGMILEEISLQVDNPKNLLGDLRIEARELIMSDYRLAVLTCVGNVGTTNVFVSGKGHSALIIGDKVYSFEVGGWITYKINDYFKDQYDIDRAVVVQEIEVGTFGEMTMAVERYVNGSFSPWYYFIPLAWPLLLFTAPAKIQPFFYPGGYCSTQTSYALKIDPSSFDTPSKIYHEIKKKFTVSRSYYIYGDPDNPPSQQEIAKIEEKIEKFIGEKVKPARKPDVRTWR